MSKFRKATKQAAKLRLALSGPSGSGKTWTALAIATAMSGKVALIDTERGSASKYSDVYAFDVLDLSPPYHPARFVEAIADAVREGFEVVVIDSLSHAWDGEGGLLEEIDNIKAKNGNNNGMDAWREATPLQQRLVDALTRAPIHVIACMRTKMTYEIEKVEERDGRMKTKVRKLGLAPVQRNDVEYEFDVHGSMDHAHTLVIGKSRCSEIADKAWRKPSGADVATPLMAWLDGEPVPNPVAGDGGEDLTQKQIDRLLALADDTRLDDVWRKRIRESLAKLRAGVHGAATRDKANGVIIFAMAKAAGSVEAYRAEVDAERAPSQDEPPGGDDPLADEPLPEADRVVGEEG